MAIKAVSKRRLLKLADFLDRLPPKRFNYATWVGGDWDGRQDLSCGTTACALGWACTIPAFRRLGLRLSSYGVPILLRGGTITHETAAAAFIFKIDQTHASYLFCPDYHLFSERLPRSPGRRASPREVAAHIRRFVAYQEAHDE